MRATTTLSLAFILTSAVLTPVVIANHNSFTEMREIGCDAQETIVDDVCVDNCAIQDHANCGAFTMPQPEVSDCGPTGNGDVSCTLSANATVTAYNWISNGKYRVLLWDACSERLETQWSFDGAEDTLDCETDVLVPQGTCVTETVRLRVTFTGTATPESMDTARSVTICA